nr:hypothetical protein [Tanacetum cinerariifolium]
MSAMGELNFFLGLQVTQKKDAIFLSQDKHVGDILKKFRYSDVRSANTPMDKENPWGNDGPGKDVELHLYRSMIGSLMYLTPSRPDIMFAVCACARHQVTPKEYHLHDVKRIFRYLKGHPKLGLWYPKESLFDLVAYSNSDYGGAAQDRKSTTKECQFLGRRLISWQCKKQTIVATSVTEAEYVAATSSCGQDKHAMRGSVKGITSSILPLYLGKYEHNADFHQIVDFVEASHIRYALTINPTVYVSHIRQFWSSARIKTTDAETKILATVDDRTRTISESSIRRNLKLHDEAGISSLPDAELFKNLTLMDEPASPFKDDSQGEACPTVSGLEAEQERENIIKTSTLPHESTSRVTSFAADEGTQELEITNLKVRIQLLKNKDGGGVALSREEAPIKRRSLETREEAGIETSTDKGSNDTEEMVNVLTSLDAASILTSGVQVSIPPAAKVAIVSIPSAGEIPTSSVVVPTASPIFTTASVVTPYTRRKGKEKMVESDTPKKKKLQEQINVQEYEQFAEDLSIAERIEWISDLVKYQDNYAKFLKYQTQQRKPCSKKQKKEYYMSVIKSHLGWKTKDFKGMTFEEIEAKFTTVWKQIEDFVPMGSKEKAETMKRKGLKLEQESVKKLKTSEEVPEEMKSSEEVPEESLKEMMQLVPVEEVYLEALQVKHPILEPATNDKEKELWVELKRLYEPDVDDQLWTHTQTMMHAPVEWKLYDMCGVHHVISKDQEMFLLVEKDYPLRKGLALVMISYKLQVENYSQMANDLILKIHKITNSPR